MSRNTIGMADSLLDYLRRVGVREDDDLAALRRETAAHPAAGMQISSEQGQLMAVLIKLLGARKTFEVGVFTGYSAMIAAKAMGPGGRVVALDVSAEYTAIARRHWAKAGLEERIDLRLAPAVESLRAMVTAGEAGTYDFAFIDADKSSYDAYYEHALKLVRQGGLISIDNVLWDGKVADPTAMDKDTAALRALNEKLKTDERVDLAMVPIGDGLTLAVKR